MPRAPRYRSWILTINNPPDNDLAKHVHEKYACWQLEKGENGTPHLQVYIQMNRVVTFQSVKDTYPTAHIEIAHRPDDAREYCRKEDTREEGPWERGDPPAQGHRTDIEECVECIQSNLGSKRPLKAAVQGFTNTFVKHSKGIMAAVNVLIEPRALEEMPKVTVLYGATGTGKTRRAMQELPEAFVWDASKGPWMDGYLGHKEMILEEFRGQMPFCQLLRLLDRYELQWPIKGGFVEIVASQFIITSPVHPREWYQSLESNEGRLDQLLRRLTEVICLDPPQLAPIFVR